MNIDANPIVEEELYRSSIINRMKQLKILDGKRIVEEERKSALKMIKRENERRLEQERLFMIADQRWI